MFLTVPHRGPPPSLGGGVGVPPPVLSQPSLPGLGVASGSGDALADGDGDSSAEDPTTIPTTPLTRLPTPSPASVAPSTTSPTGPPDSLGVGDGSVVAV